MQLRIPPPAAFLTLGVLAGCGSPPPKPTLAEWRLVTDLVVGADSNESNGLSQVKDLLVAESGHIWVLEASTQDIRVFDSTGRLERRIGRKGSGPGEFLWPDGMATGPNGTVWIHDPQNGRFALFAPSGEFLRHQVATALGYGWVWTGGVDRTGRIWDQLIEAVPEGGSERLRRAQPDWSRVDTLDIPACRSPGAKPADGFFAKPLDGSGALRYSIQVPFYPRPVQAFDWAAGAVWCAPTSAAYRLVKIGIERGDTLARIAATVPNVPVTAAERDSAIGAVRRFLASQGEADPDWSRIPSVKPVVAGALVDDEGRLWVRRSSAESGSIFDLYSAAGEPVATVRTPHGIASWVAPVVRGAYVWLVALDQDDVPYIIRGRLEP